MRLLPRSSGSLSSILLGAFILGAIYGAIIAEYRWRGEGLLYNACEAVGVGIGFALLMVPVWAISAIFRKAAARVRRSRDQHPLRRKVP
jgi:hypothetical protein